MCLCLVIVTADSTPTQANRTTGPSERAPGPVVLAAAERDSLIRSVVRDRAETEEWLRDRPTSYLATILRRDFEDRTTLAVGRAPDSDVRLDDAAVEPHHLRVTVVGDSFHVEAVDPNARFRVKDVELRDAMLGPSSVTVARFTLRLSHQRFPAIIVFDPRSPRLKEYKGLAYYPVDFSYRFVLRLEPDPRPDTVVILSTRGNRRRAVRVGWFDFRVGRARCRLEASRLLEPGVGENDLALFFRDATSGKETYPLGRYLDLERAPDGRYVLDFNHAYNPACAFSVHYNCPIPPRANTLRAAIRAGEKDSHYLGH
jgi:hypothetical protein